MVLHAASVADHCPLLAGHASLEAAVGEVVAMGGYHGYQQKYRHGEDACLLEACHHQLLASLEVDNLQQVRTSLEAAYQQQVHASMEDDVACLQQVHASQEEDVACQQQVHT
jgi:hypothetical protein